MEVRHMKLYYDRKSKDPTYYIQQGFRNGTKTSTRNIERIGKHSELRKITDDPLVYAKERVRLCNEQFKNAKVDMTMTVDFAEKLTATDDIASKSDLLNIGYLILQKIYKDLRLSDFFATMQSGSKISYECNEINRFLTFARILDPRSKLGTFDRLDTYYEKPQFEYHQIMRFLDHLQDHYDEYLEHLYSASDKIVPRNTSVCYFDCTNYYFEAEKEDPDYVDEVTGEIIKGFRKYGFSKEHRPNPLVQMGLFMDGDGIPISMCINSGSDNEQLCAIPLEKKLSKMFKGKPFIYCADAGLSSLNIRKFNSMGGHAFIVTQSIKTLSEVMKTAVFNDDGYRLLSDDSAVTLKDMKEFDRFDEATRALYNDRAYKVIPADHVVDLGLYEEKTYKNGRTRKVKSKAVIPQKIIVTFSRKMMEYQRSIRNAQIERAKNLLRCKKADEVRKGPHDVTRFIKRISKGKDGSAATDSYTIDQSVIDEEERYDGFYAVATNLNAPAKEILSINSKRYKIEDCFRVLKTNFNARPVYHQKKPRIIAHFMVCYTALLIYRLLEAQLEAKGNHFTTENILETLRNMNVSNNQDLFYKAVFRGSKVCTALNELYSLGLDKKYYLPKDLNKLARTLAK